MLRPHDRFAAHPRPAISTWSPSARQRERLISALRQSGGWHTKLQDPACSAGTRRWDPPCERRKTARRPTGNWLIQGNGPHCGTHPALFQCAYSYQTSVCGDSAGRRQRSRKRTSVLRESRTTIVGDACYKECLCGAGQGCRGRTLERFYIDTCCL
jgi:hypothetical protein